MTRSPVSVCVATYNGAKFIRAQLESIKAELTEADELIVVDDGSTDATPALLAAFMEGSPGLSCRLVVCTENRGHREAFRHAISLATRPIVVLSDQDDIWPSGRLAALVDELEPETLDLVFGSLVTFGGSSTVRMINAPRRLAGWRGLISFLVVVPPLGRRYYYCYGSAAAFRRSAINCSLPVRTESHEAWLIAQALRQRGVGCTAAVVTKRREHGSNQTRQRPPTVRLRSRLRLAASMTTLFVRASHEGYE